jgi:predicted RNA binding protein YcfA (HicA-like mRNA interferase family)
MKVRELIKRLEEDGWVQVAQRGSHRQFKHPVKKGRVTIAGHMPSDLAPGTLQSVLKQAGIGKSN